MSAYDANLSWLVPNDMGITDDTLHNDIGTKIRQIYTKGEPLADHIGDGVRVSTKHNIIKFVLFQVLIILVWQRYFFYSIYYQTCRAVFCFWRYLFLSVFIRW